MSELLNCPFCDGTNVNSEGRTQSNKGQEFCHDCGASGPHPSHDGVEATWNTRYDATKDATIERLTNALNNIDALDPECSVDGCSEHAVRGLVNRMGRIARAALEATR